MYLSRNHHDSDGSKKLGAPTIPMRSSGEKRTRRAFYGLEIYTDIVFVEIGSVTNTRNTVYICDGQLSETAGFVAFFRKVPGFRGVVPPWTSQ